MPPIYLTRSLQAEENLARRIAIEREERGMSYQALANAMTDAGCVTGPASIHKTEKANPPRRVTVSELIALAEVFDTSIDDLLMPVELRNQEKAQDLLREYQKTQEQLERIGKRINAIATELRAITGDDPDADTFISKALGT